MAVANPKPSLVIRLFAEQAVLDSRHACGMDIEEVGAHERLETIPEFDAELDLEH